MVPQGTIKRLTHRGFGFIDLGTGHDLFFHSSGLVDVGFDDLQVGDRVEFDRERDPRGFGQRATYIRRLEVAQLGLRRR